MSGFFTGGSKAAPTFTGEDREQVINPLIDQIGMMGNRFSPGRLSSAFNTPYSGQELEKNAVSSLLGMNPESYFQGAEGTLGQAGGMFSDAAGQVGSDPFGAGSFFHKAMADDFTDPTKNAQTMKMLDVLGDQGQRAFNIGADKIGASAQQASGGLGAGTAKTNALSRLGENINRDLGEQSANLLFGEQARLGGIQQSAAQQALGEGNRRAELLGALGSGLGGIGGAQTQLGGSQLGALLSQIGGLGDFGNRFAGRDLAGAMMPLDLQFQLGNLLKSSQSQQTPSGFDMMNQGMGFVGGGLGAISGLFG